MAASSVIDGMQTVCFSLGTVPTTAWLWVLLLLTIAYMLRRDHVNTRERRQLLSHLAQNQKALMAELQKNNNAVIELKTVLQSSTDRLT